MADKRGTWSKEDRNIIWKDYISNKMFKYFQKLDKEKWDFSQEAPCPLCGSLMLKAQYQGVQPDKKYSWDIDHINENYEDNFINNLQPMHPKCNKQKAKSFGKY
ncbi:HNH endonuclease signature motif containing protein [Spiroplasma floricola]|uniref:HNH endonuclease n=1 Tax=Spiroplasma floricola 23-6 TaxID=1336749 RepID=A0A2K8SEF9_9MOLU|nr:HNH endonuclease signature motif containing protein [Spiroplasma floricola]AUB31745.1 HNH endonuclease [Spiroplasma floricola 23-6]